MGRESFAFTLPYLAMYNITLFMFTSSIPYYSTCTSLVSPAGVCLVAITTHSPYKLLQLSYFFVNITLNAYVTISNVRFFFNPLGAIGNFT